MSEFPPFARLSALPEGTEIMVVGADMADRDTAFAVERSMRLSRVVIGDNIETRTADERDMAYSQTGVRRGASYDIELPYTADQYHRDCFAELAASGLAEPIEMTIEITPEDIAGLQRFFEVTPRAPRAWTHPKSPRKEKGRRR